MVRTKLRTLGLFILSVGCLSMAVTAQEPATETKPDPKKKIDWGKFTDAGTLKGEIDKVNKDGSFRIKVTTPGRPGSKAKVETHDFVFHEFGLVRWAKQPKKLDDKGKKIPWSAKETTEFKLPPGAPGYATERTTLEVGHIVEVLYARPKDLKPQEVVTSDFRVKYVVILSEPGVALPKMEEKKDDKKPPEKKKEDEKKAEEKKKP